MSFIFLAFPFKMAVSFLSDAIYATYSILRKQSSIRNKEELLEALMQWMCVYTHKDPSDILLSRLRKKLEGIVSNCAELHVPNKQKKKCTPCFEDCAYLLLNNQTEQWGILFYEDGVELCCASMEYHQLRAIQEWIQKYDAEAECEWVDCGPTVQFKTSTLISGLRRGFRYAIAEKLEIEFC